MPAVRPEVTGPICIICKKPKPTHWVDLGIVKLHFCEACARTSYGILKLGEFIQRKLKGE